MQVSFFFRLFFFVFISRGVFYVSDFLSLSLLVVFFTFCFVCCWISTNICWPGVSCELTAHLLHGDWCLPKRLAYHELIHKQVSELWFIFIFLFSCCCRIRLNAFCISLSDFTLVVGWQKGQQCAPLILKVHL